MSITKDNYLDKLFIDESKPALNRHSGGSSGPAVPTTPTDNRTSMAYWFQYLADNFKDTTYCEYDETGYMINYVIIPPEPMESIEHIVGTQNIVDFSNYAVIFIDSGEYDYGMQMERFYKKETGVPVKRMTGVLDMSCAVNASCMFYWMHDLEDVGTLKNTSRVNDFSYMFHSCHKLTSIPELDTSNGTNFSHMFTNCSGFTSIPELDTSNGTNFSYMFYSCYKLTSIPELDTSNGTNFEYMFTNCEGFTSIPELDTSNGTNFKNMFYYCTALKTIGKIDLSKWSETSTYYVSSVFSRCSALEHIGITGTISVSGLDLSYSTKLDHETLVAFLNALVKKTSGTWTITLGSTNKAKLTEDELYIATSKGWQVK